MLHGQRILVEDNQRPVWKDVLRWWRPTPPPPPTPTTQAPCYTEYMSLIKCIGQRDKEIDLSCEREYDDLKKCFKTLGLL